MTGPLIGGINFAWAINRIVVKGPLDSLPSGDLSPIESIHKNHKITRKIGQNNGWARGDF